jgi:hypothetical protein
MQYPLVYQAIIIIDKQIQAPHGELARNLSTQGPQWN